MDEPSGQADLAAFFEARRRIVAAFEEIAGGTEALASRVLDLEGAQAPSGEADPAEVARLREALEEERTANAQLEERVRLLHARAGGEAEAQLAAARARIEALEAAEAARAEELRSVLSELIPLLEEAV